MAVAAAGAGASGWARCAAGSSVAAGAGAWAGQRDSGQQGRVLQAAWSNDPTPGEHCMWMVPSY
jgi:hypothetical protein